MIPPRISALLLVLGRFSSVSGDSEGSPIVPPLFRYDDFETCRKSGVFCYVKVVFKTDVDPINSTRIETDFRHNVLDWGICVTDCEKEYEALSVEDRQRLYYPKFQINHRYIFPSDNWRSKREPFMLRYSKLINTCVNSRLERNYNLTRHGYSEIDYCTSNDQADGGGDSDWLHLTFFAVVLTLIVTVMGANAVDWFGGDQLRENIIVSSFSVRRNWARFTEEPKTELYRDFGYIDGLRLFVNVFILVLHCLLVAGVIPMINPEYVEKVMKSRLMVTFCSTAPVSVQTFFVISGLLLMVNFLKDVDRKPEYNGGYFRSKIVNRLIRLLPVYYFFLLLTAVVDSIPGLKIGANGYHTLLIERDLCRQYWWMNILFVNNLPLAEEGCFLQGWYLGADQQLFLGALLILAVMWKVPSSRVPLLGIFTALAVIIPTSLVYSMELESVLPIRMSDVHFILMYQPWFRHIYQPSYSNMNGFIAGMIVGYLYHQTRNGKLNLQDSKLYKVVKKCSILVLLCGVIPIHLFYEYEIERSSWWTMVHFVMYHNYGVLFGSVCFIECFLNPPGPIRKFLSLKPLTCLGKLSYSVYVLHVPVMRILLNYTPALPYFSFTNLTILLIVVTILCYLAGLVVYFCIEQPMSLILKHGYSDCRATKVEKGQ